MEIGQSKALLTWWGYGSDQRARFLHSTVCSRIPTAGKMSGLMGFVSQVFFHDFDFFPRESMAKKRGKMWEVADVQPSFIRTGLGHVLGFGSWNMLSSPQHEAPQISWPCNSSSDKCQLMSNWCEMKSFFSVCQIMTFWFGLSWPETKHSVLIFVIRKQTISPPSTATSGAVCYGHLSSLLSITCKEPVRQETPGHLQFFNCWNLWLTSS